MTDGSQEIYVVLGKKYYNPIQKTIIRTLFCWISSHGRHPTKMKSPTRLLKKRYTASYEIPR